MKKYTQINMHEISKETEKAILIEGNWLPKSQLLVIVNNQYFDYTAKEIKEYKEKTIYCLLCPLWLHMKNNLSFKKSNTIDELLNKLNIDKRTTIEYEAFKILSYKEYKGE